MPFIPVHSTNSQTSPEGEFRGNFYPPNFLGGKPPLLGAVWEQRREIPGIVEKLVKWKKRKKSIQFQILGSAIPGIVAYVELAAIINLKHL
jgi:hypothetical protein